MIPPNCKKCGNKMHKGSRTAAGKIRWTCRSKVGEGSYCSSTTLPDAPLRDAGGRGAVTKFPVFERTLGGVTTLLVTSAQNATPTHDGFIKSLEQHANDVDASDIIICPYRYRNPTSRFYSTVDGKNNLDYWMVPKEYLLSKRKQLNSNLTLFADWKIQATSGNPLGRKDSVSGAQSAIYPHPRLQLKTIATPQSQYAKILTTTGTCTEMNYTDTDLGQLAEFHHTLGACLVELKGKKFHIRQINAQRDTGEYIDLSKHYNGLWDGPHDAGRYEALVLGDWHKDFTLKNVERATFGEDGMVSILRPKVIAWHDLADFYSVNPHHTGNWLIKQLKIDSGRINARAELIRACQYVGQNTPPDTTSVIIPSNHNDFLARWLLSTDPRDLAGDNFELWCETALAVRRSGRITERGAEYIDAFTYWARKFFADEGYTNVKVLDRGDDYRVKDVELGFHFDKGPNGARGSRMNMRRIGVRTMGGHGHGPGIDEGATQVGTGTGVLEYTLGSPSNWMNTHGTINALGKRCLLNIIGNNWRLE
jgi:hypothetical protein